MFKAKQKIKNKFDLSFWITTVFLLLCMVLYMYFPANDVFQYKAVAFSFFLLIPGLYFWFIIKEKSFIKQINLGDWKENLKWTGIGIIGPFVLAALVLKFTNILTHYPLSLSVRNDFGQFLSYELLGISVTVAFYEIFFRGFVQFYFKQFFGWWSVLIQFVLFLSMVLILGIPFMFYFLYLLFVPFAGFISYKSNSIVYSFLGQLVFIIIMDATAIKLLAR